MTVFLALLIDNLLVNFPSLSLVYSTFLDVRQILVCALHISPTLQYRLQSMHSFCCTVCTPTLLKFFDVIL